LPGKAGDQPSNLILALAFAFAGCNEISLILFKQLGVNPVIRDTLGISTFILGAGFFILAAARFPRKLAPEDIASSQTTWGRIRPVRAVLILFLRAPAVWAFVATGAILTGLSDNPLFFEAN